MSYIVNISHFLDYTCHFMYIYIYMYVHILVYIVCYIHTYSSTNIVRVIKSRRIRWAGHVERMGKRRGAYRVLLGNLSDREHLEDPGVDGSIML